jgi:hypothetical protein
MKKDGGSALSEDFQIHLAGPARRALAAAGIRDLAHLARFREGEIRRLHGIGPNAMQQLTRTLAERGLAFTPDEEEQVS